MQLGFPVPEPGLPPLPRRELHALEFASSDSMTAFWSDGLKPRLPEKHHATVDKIAECMIDDYLIVTCGQLRKACRADVEGAIVSQGGKATWVGAIEALLGCEFRDPASTGVPASAALLSSVHHHLPLFEEDCDEKLGATLKRAKALHLACAPVDTLKKEVFTNSRCTNPSSDPIPSTETGLLVAKSFDFVFMKHGKIGGDAVLFDAIGAHLAGSFPRPHSKFWALGWNAQAIYSEKCRIFWQGKRNKRAGVSLPCERDARLPPSAYQQAPAAVASPAMGAPAACSSSSPAVVQTPAVHVW